MATYVELQDLAQDTVFVQRTKSALIVTCDKILNEDPSTPNHQLRLGYIKGVFMRFKEVKEITINLFLSRQQSLTPTEILAIADQDLQKSIENIITTLAII